VDEATEIRQSFARNSGNLGGNGTVCGAVYKALTPTARDF
jgi:hypothetical protein